MRGTVLYGPRDVRFEERDVPTIIEPTDAIIRISATCVCGSDLWPYRGINPIAQPTPMGHEYCGIAAKGLRSTLLAQYRLSPFSSRTIHHAQAAGKLRSNPARGVRGIRTRSVRS